MASVADPSNSGGLSSEDRRAIREELERILSSSWFRRSPKCREFLRFVVERTLAGQAESLKERTIAVEHFGKSHDIDLDRDSTVRVCARNTRSRLESYYAAGSAGRFRIELAPGSYVPVFRRAGPEISPEPEPPQAPASRPPRPRQPWKVAAVAGLLAVSALLALFPAKLPGDPLTKFWEPALTAPGGVEVLIAAPPDPAPPPEPAEMEAGSVGGEPKSPGASQASAAAEILHFLRDRGAEARIGDYRRIREEQIPEKAVIIVGASAFRGPHSWLKGCPIQPDTEADPPRFFSVSGQEWSSPSGGVDAGYAAIYRIPAEKPRPFILLIAGLNARASEMAAGLLVQGERLAGLLRDAPSGWEKARMVLLMEIGRGSARSVKTLLW